ncbi:MAG: class F sortase [Marmoricola sp.]
MSRTLVQQAALGVLALTLTQGLLGAAGTSAVSARSADTPAVACSRPAHGFTPSKAQIPAIGRTLKVIQVRRTSSNAVGAGPVTEKGKWLMAMDPVTKPSSRRGSVILSGHTWPDGSALGNAMLANLDEGEGIVLVGKKGKKACYRITQRTSYLVRDVPEKKAFRSSGPEQLVIVACSGTRTSPGHWTRRTIWYAKPFVPAAPTQPSAPPPAAPPGDLLSGLLGLF